MTSGAAAFSTLTLMYAMLDLIHDYDQTNYLLTCLVHIQRADGDFGAVDLLEPSAALSYFRELCSSFTDVPSDVIDNFFQDVTRLVRSQGEPGVKAHRVLREVSEKVHEILVKSKGAEGWDTVVYEIHESTLCPTAILHPVVYELHQLKNHLLKLIHHRQK